MTEQTTPGSAEAQAVVVQPTASERLATLHALYADAKAAADEAEERLDAIKAGIKAELAQAAPEGSQRILLPADPETGGPALTLTYSERATFDSRRFKREDPETYVRYAKFSGTWTLAAAKGGASE